MQGRGRLPCYKASNPLYLQKTCDEQPLPHTDQCRVFHPHDHRSARVELCEDIIHPVRKLPYHETL